MFNGLLTVYFLKCMIQHADFIEYLIINPIVEAQNTPSSHAIDDAMNREGVGYP